MADEVMQALGRIEGKVDEIRAAAKEHRDDDTRRFTDVYQKLGQHAEDINQAKGAKTIIVWLAGGGLLSLATAVYALLKVAGKA